MKVLGVSFSTIENGNCPKVTSHCLDYIRNLGNEKLYNVRMVDFELSDPGRGENGIHRIGLRDNNGKKICSDRGPFNIDKNFIYYCPNNAEIYKTDIERRNKEKITNGGSDNITVKGD